MSTPAEDERALETLERRLGTLLPEPYQGSSEEVQPVSMGSAGLKFRSDGTVAWDEIWATFCDLAMAGGPPHKGSLLEPGSLTEIHANPGRHRQVVDEVCRGIHLVTGLEAERSDAEGWVRVDCRGDGMAGWLTRAIAMENVSVRCEGAVLQLPAGPGYRLEKEIKNVVTVIAKTCHYWVDHMRPSRQQAIADLLEEMEQESPLIQPAVAGYELENDPYRSLSSTMAESIDRSTGVAVAPRRYAGWLGVDCPSVRAAIWMMRLMVAGNALSRREGTTVFVPVNPVTDPDGERCLRMFFRVQRLAVERGIV